MEKALDFLDMHRDAAFATVEDGRPKIRVFRIMKIVGAELYFATSADKNVYRQLTVNPRVEILAMDGNISVRAAGKAAFDVEDAVGREIYEANPVLKRLYRDYTDLVYFRLCMESLDYYDLTPTPPVSEHYGFSGR